MKKMKMILSILVLLLVYSFAYASEIRVCCKISDNGSLICTVVPKDFLCPLEYPLSQ